MTSFSEYIRNNQSAWHYHFLGLTSFAGQGWNFGFVRGRNSRNESAYRIGPGGFAAGNGNDQYSRNHRVNTEEFATSTEGVVLQQKDWVDVHGNSSGFEGVVGVTSDGSLWAYRNVEDHVSTSYNRFGQGADPSPLNTSQLLSGNVYGHFSRFGRRLAYVRVYGDSDSFDAVRFIHCRGPSAALDERSTTLVDSDGDLWMAGNKLPGTSEQLLYFTKFVPTSYINADGEQTIDASDPLKWSDVWITDEGKIIKPGRGGIITAKAGDPAGWPPNSSKLVEVSGFVDRVAVNTAGANLANGTRTATASAPQHPNGNTALAEVVIAGNVVTSIRLTTSGWGYTAAPTFTISTSPGETAPTFTATLFSSTWDKFFHALRNAPMGAVSADGIAYSLGANPIRLRGTQSPDGYADIARNNLGTLLLTQTGDLEYLGLNPSGGADAIEISAVTSATGTYTHVASNAAAFFALRDDGVVFSYGNETWTGRKTGTNWGQIDGGARFTKLFSSNNSIFLVRDESYDSLGNRVSPLAYVGSA
jgi:hypothetical protein